MLIFAVIFSLSLLLSLILTPLVKQLALSIQAVDVPNHRKVHDTHIPRLGGLAVYASFMLVFYGAIYFDIGGARGFAEWRVFLRGFAIGSLIIVVMGFMDDMWGLRPLFKLALQLAAGLVVYFHGFRIELVEIPYFKVIHMGWISLPFTLLWIAGITNAINLIDGLDGLASGVSFIAVMTIFLVALSQGNDMTALFAITLAGCIVGFLKYNINPAQIFLGDSGAQFLGFSLATFSVVGAMKSSTAVALLIPIIALGFPIMDTFLAIIRRTVRASRDGKGFKHIGEADREHVHHKLMEMGYTHRGAVVVLYLLCLIFGAFAFILTAYRNEVAATILFFVGLIVFVFVRKVGYLEFRGLKEGNFLEQYLARMGGRKDEKKESTEKTDDKEDVKEDDKE